MSHRQLMLGVFFLLATASRTAAADCNQNGQDDAADISSGTSMDCNHNGIPDECDIARRIEPAGDLRLAESCMFFMAWPRDTSIVCGDLDGDGAPDLATTNCGSEGTLSVLLNQGGGAFGPEALYPAGVSPIGTVGADLDGDGDLDIATCSYATNEVLVLLNAGDGSFAPPRSFPGAPPNTTALVAADLDGDGDADIAVSGSEKIQILLNSGDGGFSQGSSFAPGGAAFLYPKNLASADLDGDGDQDLIAGDNSIALWRNGGGATFTGPTLIPMAGGNPGFCWTHTILTADVNGDQRLDIVTADYTDGGTPSISILANQGGFAFSGPTPTFFSFNDECQYAGAGDLDLDGDVDLVAVGGGRIGRLTNSGNGTFTGPSYYEISGRTSVVVAEDIDGDGDPDLLVKRWEDEARWISVLKNEATSIDADGDGIPDECEPGVVLVDSHDVWSFFRGREAPPADWNEEAFNDSAWEQGPTGIGYGDGDDLTVLNDMQGSYLAVFCRKSFEIDEPAAVKALVLQVDYDDGFVAYLNGAEVARANMPPSPVFFDTRALTAVEPGTPRVFDIGGAIGLLRRGSNVLAVEVHNTNVQSSDLSFIPRLLAAADAPPAPSLSVSSAVIPLGSSGEVSVLLTSAEPVQAFSFGVAHSPLVAVLEAIALGDSPEVVGLNGGSGPEFFDFDIDAGTEGCGPQSSAGGTVYAIASKNDPEVAIAAGSGIELVRLRYRAAPGASAGASSPLEIVGCLGDFRPWDLVITIRSSSRTPAVMGGTLTISDAVTVFRRGDANRDDVQDISDVVTILMYLFGNHTIDCQKAVDVNDDGETDISDALRLLFYLFRNAEALPQPSMTCGPDPTPDGLSCDIDPGC